MKSKGREGQGKSMSMNKGRIQDFSRGRAEFDACERKKSGLSLQKKGMGNKSRLFVRIFIIQGDFYIFQTCF